MNNESLLLQIPGFRIKRQYELCYRQRRSQGAALAVNAGTNFAVPHPPCNNFALIAMMVPIIMCRVPHPLKSKLSGYASDLY